MAGGGLLGQTSKTGQQMEEAEKGESQLIIVRRDTSGLCIATSPVISGQLHTKYVKLGRMEHSEIFLSQIGSHCTLQGRSRTCTAICSFVTM
jgi:hypothetical protein